MPEYPAGYVTPAALGGNPTVALGTSITIRAGDAAGAIRDATSWFTWAALLSNGQIGFSRNAGVAGNLTSDLLARFGTDVAAYSPRTCIIEAGTNDAYGSALATPVFAANIKALVAACRQSRITPVLCSVMQRSDVANALIETYNDFLSVYCRLQGIKLLDFYGAVLDPTTGLTKAIYTTDGVHPSGAGAQILGQLAATQMGLLGGVTPPWVPPLAQHQAAHSSNLIANGLFLNNASGLGTGWVATGLATPSIIAGTGGNDALGNWQRIALNPDNSSSNVHSAFVVGGAGTYQVGDRLAFCGRLQSSCVGGTTPGTVIAEMSLLNGGRTINPAYYLPGVFGPSTFYAETVAAAGEGNGIYVYLFLPGGAGAANDFAQLAQVTVKNLSKLGSLV